MGMAHCRRLQIPVRQVGGNMRLISFHVKVFRNVIDSGEIAVDDVTCLVGKNEAGKSALLAALHMLNPASPSFSLSLLDDYPRWLKKEHEISGEISDAVPILAKFELSQDEVDDLASRFGVGVLKSPIVSAFRKYTSTQIEIKADLDLRAFIDPFVASLPEALQAELGGLDTSQALIARIDEVVAATNPDDATSTALADHAQAAKSSLAEILGAPSLTEAVGAHIRGGIPRTFYFSIYAQLVGRYNLEDVFAAIQSGSEDEETQAAADFLKLARIVPATVADWDYEASNAELESISSLLTKRVKEHWKQNDHLRLRVTIEPQKVPRPGGEDIIRFLQFRVEDELHYFSNRLDRRSTGFRWFVSFMASFLEFEKEQNLILLLDEPGLSLHARAQMDLMDTIEDKLANDRQVLYSTHSPFMVRTSALARTRIVEDQGPALGSITINDVGKVSDPDTLFPLQAALGYDVVQSLFIGNRNVLVEGVSDFIYISMLSEHLRSLGRDSLPDDCRLLPAGGASNIPTFIALLGGHLDLVVLIDGNTDSQRIENSITRGRLAAEKVLSLDQFSNVTGADIEDVFTPGEYLALYNGTFGASLKVGDLNGSDRIVKRISRHSGDFNHGAVAAYFLRNLPKSLSSLSAGTLDRFENLIRALNGALPPA